MGGETNERLKKQIVDGKVMKIMLMMRLPCECHTNLLRLQDIKYIIVWRMLYG